MSLSFSLQDAYAGTAHKLENPLAAVSLAQLGATRARPLFLRDRRPPAVAQPVHYVAPPPEPPNLSLLGVILDPHAPRATVRNESTGSTLQLHIGSIVDDWRVSAISAQRLTLALGRRSDVVLMFKDARANQKMASLRPVPDAPDGGRGPDPHRGSSIRVGGGNSMR